MLSCRHFESVPNQPASAFKVRIWTRSVGHAKTTLGDFLLSQRQAETKLGPRLVRLHDEGQRREGGLVRGGNLP